MKSTQAQSKTKKVNNGNIRKSGAFTLAFIFAVFWVLIITVVIELGVAGILLRLDVIQFVEDFPMSGFSILVIFLTSSTIIGIGVSYFTGIAVVRPINTLVDSMARLASGDYNTRVKLGKAKIMHTISASFNTLAEELQNTEMLRSDFTNNFSHEFKTPINSIYGFAKLLGKGGLTAEQEKEYIAIIEQEAKRLSNMATGVLNLTKIENQSILTNKERYNLAEQLRNCILMFERKWTDKRLDMTVNLDETTISAQEALMAQVWINLLDNAIKFAPDGSELTICSAVNEQMVSVAISNYGDSISDANKKRIFQKFFQGDASHGAEGYGIGLAVVKRIIDLHKGRIDIVSQDGLNTFTVTLPL